MMKKRLDKPNPIRAGGTPKILDTRPNPPPGSRAHTQAMRNRARRIRRGRMSRAATPPSCPEDELVNHDRRAFLALSWKSCFMISRRFPSWA